MAQNTNTGSAAPLEPSLTPIDIEPVMHENTHETNPSRQQVPSVEFHGIASITPPKNRSFDEYKDGLFALVESNEPPENEDNTWTLFPEKILDFYMRVFLIIPPDRALSYEKLVASYVS